MVVQPPKIIAAASSSSKPRRHIARLPFIVMQTPMVIVFGFWFLVNFKICLN
jgi:hypothetical protein